MFRTLSNILKVTDLRNRILFTLGLLIVFRIGAFIPVPNIDREVLKTLDQQLYADIFGLLNTFSGGALFNFSIFAMSIYPYVTASIIVQLLSMDVIPKFAEWAKEGEIGRRKLAQFTRYGTVLFGLIQAIGMSIGFNRLVPGIIDNPGFGTYALIAITLTAGTAFLMWLGEQITDKGVGNGISVVIFAGIVAGIPGGIQRLYLALFSDRSAIFFSILKVLLLVVAVVVLVVGVIYVQQAVRKIPVQYTKRVVGRRMYGGQSTHIPLRVNAAGVIPIIFALSLIMLPYTIASFWSSHPVAKWIMNELFYTAPIGMVLYVFLIIAFTYFYTFVQINPQQLSDQMKKNGGYIPGIRPGKATEIYLTRVMSRITLFGALFLAFISVLPVFFTNVGGLPRSISIGGTSLLIVVGVALETMKQIESQLIRRHYKGFINR